MMTTLQPVARICQGFFSSILAPAALTFAASPLQSSDTMNQTSNDLKTTTPGEKPNIIFILVDDMGWRDLACTGSSFYETPVLDKLASEGMLFTDAYAAAPICSPTRASLLTGKYPANVGVTNFIARDPKSHPRGRLIEAPYVRELPLEEFNLARALKENGYQTWHVGKWHLGEAPFYPEHQGFDVNIGGWNAGFPAKGFYPPWEFPNLPDAPEGTYLTDHLTDEAIRLIRDRNRAKPYFLNLWHYAVHTPIQAPADLVKKYEAKAKRLGLDKVEAFEAGENFPIEKDRDKPIFRRVVQSDAVYAAMIENLDTNIGRLLEAVDDPNTIVIFTSDNGGLHISKNGKPGLWGGPTSNLPLAEGKGWMYEGGSRVPLIVSWPGHIAPGTTSDVPVTSPDFFPTLLEAAGLPLKPEQHEDGVSFFKVLEGGGDFERGPIYWHFPHYAHHGGTPGSSVRDGDWKLIEFFEDGRLELYNLKDDPGEKNNLAEKEPARAADLHAKLKSWRDSMEAKYPTPNPGWSDLGRDSGPVSETPNIDRLVSGGNNPYGNPGSEHAR